MVSIGIICIGLFSGITILVHLAVCFGIIRCRRLDRKISVTAETGENAVLPQECTVIVPAKDEAENLPALLRSLENQTPETFSIVLVNDRSADSTGAIMEDFRARYASRVRVLTLTENPETGNPKKYALQRGIEAAPGKVFLFTDADCSLPPGWVAAMARRFTDSGTGIVLGPVHPRKGNRYLHTYQLFDHVFRYFYTAGSAGMGMPTGGFGNNLGVDSEAVHSIGGYSGVKPTVTEDAALIAAVREKTAGTVRASVSPDILVNTAPQESWRALFRQEIRWSSGAFFSGDFGTAAGYSSVMIFLLGGLAAIPLSFVYLPLVFIVGTTFLSMFSVAFLGGLMLGLKPKEYWFFLPVSLVWSSIFYTAVNIAALARVPVRWKGTVVSVGK